MILNDSFSSFSYQMGRVGTITLNIQCVIRAEIVSAAQLLTVDMFEVIFITYSQNRDRS